MTAERKGSPTSDGAAALVAALLALDPAALGGVVLSGRPGPGRDHWLKGFRALLGDGVPFRRVPLHASETQLLGGLDLAATLSAGRPVASRGLLAGSDGGVLILAGAERLDLQKAAVISAALDRGEVQLERDGISLTAPAHFGVIALDEALGEDEAVPSCLIERLALSLTQDHLEAEGEDAWVGLADAVAAARLLLPKVTIEDAAIESLAAASLALGIGSLRIPVMAARVARHSAALAGRSVAGEDDLKIAAALVLAPRARALPQMEDDDNEQTSEPEQPPPPPEGPHEGEMDTLSDAELKDLVLEAAAASIPENLLRRLGQDARARRARAQGRQGAKQVSRGRGRPAGTRAGRPGNGVRLSVLETLRAAAPWQRLRGRTAHATGERRARLVVRGEDFRVLRMKHPAESTTIFVVDGSGSHALHRLAEAKGAVELLLSECYVRRDRVALILFRGTGAEVLLPPTRSLARAKKALGALPGGGATPLAAGLDQALSLGLLERKKGKTPTLVLLTDGKANVDRAGNKGRSLAEADAMAAGKVIRASGVRSLVIDTSPQRAPHGHMLAEAMGAQYLLLPRATSHALSEAVRLTSGLE